MVSASPRVLISAEQIGERVGELGREISSRYANPADGKPLHLIGVLNGAFVFLADLARAIGGDVTIDFIQASSYGASTASSGEVRVERDIHADIAGRDVLLVEDIIDTGLTAAFLIERLRRQGPRSIEIVALLNKPARRTRPIEAAYIGFDIPDQFVVGYGLDFDQRYRNLPSICVLDDPGPPASEKP